MIHVMIQSNCEGRGSRAEAWAQVGQTVGQRANVARLKNRSNRSKLVGRQLIRPTSLDLFYNRAYLMVDLFLRTQICQHNIGSGSFHIMSHHVIKSRRA